MPHCGSTHLATGKEHDAPMAGFEPGFTKKNMGSFIVDDMSWGIDKNQRTIWNFTNKNRDIVGT
jgi:hypothetical protein